MRALIRRCRSEDVIDEIFCCAAHSKIIGEIKTAAQLIAQDKTVAYAWRAIKSSGSTHHRWKQWQVITSAQS